MTFPECTGFENTRGRCWWCGGELPGRRQRYCCEEHGERYRASFHWAYARAAALRRTGGLCERCPEKAAEVHHIVPLVGPRHTNTGNLQENLRPLCRPHHLEAKVRPPRKARVKSQGVFYMHNGQRAWAMARRIGALYRRGAYLPPQGWDVVEALDGCWWTDIEGNVVSRAEGVGCHA